MTVNLILTVYLIFFQSYALFMIGSYTRTLDSLRTCLFFLRYNPNDEKLEESLLNWFTKLVSESKRICSHTY